MHNIWREFRCEPAGAVLVAANVLGLVLVAWLLVIAS